MWENRKGIFFTLNFVSFSKFNWNGYLDYELPEQWWEVEKKVLLQWLWGPPWLWPHQPWNVDGDDDRGCWVTKTQLPELLPSLSRSLSLCPRIDGLASESSAKLLPFICGQMQGHLPCGLSLLLQNKSKSNLQIYYVGAKAHMAREHPVRLCGYSRGWKNWVLEPECIFSRVLILILVSGAHTLLRSLIVY